MYVFCACVCPFKRLRVFVRLSVCFGVRCVCTQFYVGVLQLKKQLDERTHELAEKSAQMQTITQKLVGFCHAVFSVAFLPFGCFHGDCGRNLTCNLLCLPSAS